MRVDAIAARHHEVALSFSIEELLLFLDVVLRLVEVRLGNMAVILVLVAVDVSEVTHSLACAEARQGANTSTRCDP